MRDESMLFEVALDDSPCVFLVNALVQVGVSQGLQTLHGVRSEVVRGRRRWANRDVVH